MEELKFEYSVLYSFEIMTRVDAKNFNWPNLFA